VAPQRDPDHELRVAAHEAARRLSQRYDDLVPRAVLQQGFSFRGERISFGSFYRGIHRPRQMRGPAALTLMTAPPRPGREPPYEDQVDIASRAILYHYRAGSENLADNRALRAAFELQVPLIYFWGMAPGQYMVVQPVFITRDDPATRTVLMEVGLPQLDVQEGRLASTPDVRAYALREVRVRLHQHEFRRVVMRAYRSRCTICALREPALVQAAHIVEDRDDAGVAHVANGLALCAIHHLAYDRNLLGIDPDGVVHVNRRLREERDGPMLRAGLQGFHGATIALPRRPEDRPAPDRLALRFARFEEEAA
jgi:putative restriction endonuclease